jgi:hypothetical protein
MFESVKVFLEVAGQILLAVGLKVPFIFYENPFF